MRISDWSSDVCSSDLGPDHFGADNCRKLQQRFPDAHLVVLADEFQYDEVAEAFRFGVDGYIVKEISCEPLISSLHLVALGEKVMPSQLARTFATGAAGFKRKNWRESLRSKEARGGKGCVSPSRSKGSQKQKK